MSLNKAVRDVNPDKHEHNDEVNGRAAPVPTE